MFAPNIEELKLGKNRLFYSAFPDTIGTLEFLTRLDMSNNQLEYGEFCWGFKESSAIISNPVKILLLLRSIPDAISKLKALVYLNLSKNLLSSIPDAILKDAESTELEELILFSNSITEIDDRIESLDKLTHLDLNENKISSIPFCLGNCRSLLTLKLAMNGITELSDNCKNLLWWNLILFTNCL